MNRAAMKQYIVHHKKMAVFLVIAALGGITVLARGNSPIEYTSAKVERVDLAQTVTETGQVVSDVELNYGFEATGRVVEIVKKIGDDVKKGDLIARIENTRERARLNEGLASLASAQARLQVELAGPSDQDRTKSAASVDQARAAFDQKQQEFEKTKVLAAKNIDVAKKNLESAQNDLKQADGGEQSEIISDAYDNLVNTLKASVASGRSALGDADNILGIENISANNDFEAVLSPNGLNAAKTSYYAASTGIKAGESAVVVLTPASDRALIDAAVQQALAGLDALQKNLFDVQQVLSDTQAGGSLSQAELDTLKSSISSARTAVTTALTNVTKAKQAVTTARTSLSTYTIAYQKAVLDVTVAEKQAVADIAIAEALMKASEASLRQAEAQHSGFVSPPRAVDVASLRADVARQAASVQALRDDVRKTELTALADGVLAKLDIDVGETAVQNTQVVRINSDGLSIHVDISESDVSKLSVADAVSITLDALGEKIIFQGSVASIEPSETEVSGVVYYKTTVIFNDTLGHDIRPGMTANVAVTTDAKSGVLVVPQRAVLEEQGQLIVRVLTDAKKGTFAKREITTGLRGDNGLVEVVSGLNEGEEVVTFVKEKK